MDETDERLSDRDIKHIGGACIAAGAMFAYFAQPILRFANPLDLVCGGGVTAALLVACWSSFISATTYRKQKLCAAGATAIVGLFLVIVIAPALGRSRVHDRHCRQIEIQMMGPEAARDDLPEIFSALQCRPQVGNLRHEQV